MSQRIVDKLRDSGGVTILMALFAMLVASVVCIIILGASVTAVKQSTIDCVQEQNTLTLQSAGELVRSEILNTGTIEFEGAQTENGGVDYNVKKVIKTSLSGELVAAAEMSLENNGQEGAGGFTIEATSNDSVLTETYEQPAVTGSFVLRDDPDSEDQSAYQLVVTLSVPDPNSNSPQYLFLTVDCTRVVDPVAENTSNLRAAFSWNNPRFSLAEGASTNG